jgi:hypothetical protein
MLSELLLISVLPAPISSPSLNKVFVIFVVNYIVI